MEAMTVGQLIDALSKYPRDERVLVEDGQGWWREIDRVEGPGVVLVDVGPRLAGETDAAYAERSLRLDWNESDDYSLPTIFFGEAFDARSL